MEKVIKIKQIWAVEWKGTMITQALTEDGEIYIWERDLETEEDSWKIVVLPTNK